MDPMEPESYPADPAGCLRSLAAEALLSAHPGRPLFPVSLALQPVANAFVMLGLLPEPQAEEILAGHRLALGRKGFPDVWGASMGELTVRPGAHEYWDARTAGPAALREIPLSVAAAGVQCPTSVAGICFDWVKLTSAGLRVSFRATAPDPGGDLPVPDVPMRQAISEISVTDDTGVRYDLAVAGVGGGRIRGRQEWRGQVHADLSPAGAPDWVEFSPVLAGGSGRVALPPPAQLPVGVSEPPWPTPAECYLAALATVTRIAIATAGAQAEAGPEDTAEIIAKVADSLLAVGALPVTSTLLRESGGSRPGWHTPLTIRWGRRARRRIAEFRATEHRGLTVALPLRHATAVIESVSAQGQLVSIQLYGHPWVRGEYWPMIAPCFQVRATDDAGDVHDGIPGGGHVSAVHDGSGSFWFWPPVDPARKSIRVTVSTLWEAAWADVELPR